MKITKELLKKKYSKMDEKEVGKETKAKKKNPKMELIEAMAKKIKSKK